MNEHPFAFEKLGVLPVLTGTSPFAIRSRESQLNRKSKGILERLALPECYRGY